MRTRVKICGITREQDALIAARYGADAIGFVFYEASPRFVDIKTAASIASKIPPFVSRVGLFVDSASDKIEAVLANMQLDCLQFHGDESPAECESYGLSYIKAVAMREDVDLAGIAAAYRSATGLLLDAHVPGIPGGSGRVFDWSRIRRDLDKPLILAGGLTPDNVCEAIDQVKPYAVDVSSGVEKSKGIKDAVRVAAFMNEVNRIT